jgi:hypothetical protein
MAANKANERNESKRCQSLRMRERNKRMWRKVSDTGLCVTSHCYGTGRILHVHGPCGYASDKVASFAHFLSYSDLIACEHDRLGMLTAMAVAPEL